MPYGQGPARVTSHPGFVIALKTVRGVVIARSRFHCEFDGESCHPPVQKQWAAPARVPARSRRPRTEDRIGGDPPRQTAVTSSLGGAVERDGCDAWGTEP